MKDVGVEIPKVDCRKLKMGGWEGAKIQTRISGKWAQFYSHNGLNQINHLQQIDYTKKWKPPKRPSTVLQKNRPGAFDADSYTQAVIASQAMRKEMVNEFVGPKTTRVQDSAQGPRTEIQRKVCVLSSDEFVVPVAQPIIKKHGGHDLGRFPFRLNIDCIDEMRAPKHTPRRATQQHLTGDLFVITSNINKSLRFPRTPIKATTTL